MSVVVFHDVHKSFGPQVVFDRLSVQFYPGQKVGLIGPNGSGKTTLFRMILGTEQPDIGKVVCAKNLKIGYLPQEPLFDGSKTVMEEMHEGMSQILTLNRRIEDFAEKMETLSGSELKKAMAEYDKLCHRFETEGGYACEARIKSILTGLDIGPEHYNAKTAVLSGGQLSRLGLARVLVKDTNLLLLDEPTNHLDLQAATWLESFLKAYNGSVILISHDRYLLDKVCEKIIELEHRRARVWKGNYTLYVQTKETVALAEAREHEKRTEMVSRTLDFIARNKDQEGMRKTARGRKTRLERLLKENPDYLEKGKAAQTIRFSFAETDVKSDLVLRAENVSKSFGSLTLFENLSFDVGSGQAMGITGPNGTGKTTLLKLALGHLAPDAGAIRLGANLRVGYLDQQATTLNPDGTLLDEVRAVRPDLSPEVLRGKLGAFLFSGEDAFKKVGDLSGGQQNRLMLCKLVLTEPDVLILDEPTNHLDIPSRQMLEEALLDYNGAIVAVSHDRYFLDRIAESLLVIGTDAAGQRQIGQTRTILSAAPDTDGVYSTYAQLVERSRQAAQHQKIAEKKKNAAAPSPRQKTPPHLREFNKYTVEQIEEMISRQEQTVEQMQHAFGDEKIYLSRDLLTRLQADFETEKQRLALLYEVWEYRVAD
ncbi:MAG: ABC-F family ATP-binding cassette domain-containing protein [Planctomycetales bacterium]|nr:ABC-F family ATP-binding cassette domain-containing protein [Planctomycetales bacterium]